MGLWMVCWRKWCVASPQLLSTGMKSVLPAGRQSFRAQADTRSELARSHQERFSLDGPLHWRAATTRRHLLDGCRSGRGVVKCYANVAGAMAPAIAPNLFVTANSAQKNLIMDRFEYIVRHGDFRVVASAEKVEMQRLNQARWKVLVSMWPLGKDPAISTPEMIHLEDPRSTDPAEALSNAVALAQQRIDERRH